MITTTANNNTIYRPPIQGGFFNYSKPNTPHEKTLETMKVISLKIKKCALCSVFNNQMLLLYKK